MGFKFPYSLINKKERFNENMIAADMECNIKASKVLLKDNIKLNLPSADKYEAIRIAGRLLAQSGYVDENYIEAMIEREDDLTTYMGNGVAIPHGVGRAREYIKKSGIVVLQFPEGVDFGEEKAYLVIGIAGIGDEHIDILSNVATVIGEEDKMKKLRKTRDVDYVYEIFTGN